MNISKLASTVIMATSIATFFLFAFIFYLYGGDTKAIEKALSTTSGFFGGIATLVATYIASQLFNDWRQQHDKQLENQFSLRVMDNFENFKSTYFMNFNPNVSLSEEHIKSNLDDMMNSCEILNNKLRTIQDTYTNYCLLIKKSQPNEDLEIIRKMRKSFFDLEKESNPINQQKKYNTELNMI